MFVSLTLGILMTLMKTDYLLIYQPGPLSLPASMSCQLFPPLYSVFCLTPLTLRGGGRSGSFSSLRFMFICLISLAGMLIFFLFSLIRAIDGISGAGPTLLVLSVSTPFSTYRLLMEPTPTVLLESEYTDLIDELGSHMLSLPTSSVKLSSSLSVSVN